MFLFSKNNTRANQKFRVHIDWLIMLLFRFQAEKTVYALYAALKEGLTVKHLMFIESGGKAHLENKRMIELISGATGIPAIVVGKKPQDVAKGLKKLGADLLVSGVTTTPDILTITGES